MKKQYYIQTIYRRSFSILGLSAVFILWLLLTQCGYVQSIFLPSPHAVWSASLSMLNEGILLRDIGASFLRIFFGLLISFLIAFPIGVFLALQGFFEKIFHPVIAFIRYIPPTAFIPLAILWFGIGETEKIVIIVLGIAPYLAIMVADAITNVKQDLLNVAFSFGATKKQTLRYVLIPAAAPAIWDALRIMTGAAWTYVIVVEIVGSSVGLGHLMIESQRFLQTPRIFAAVIIIGFLGLLTDNFFKITYHLFFHWSEKAHARNKKSL